ncbi:piRNA biogenesis protein EXD1 isoform X2 [Hyperolius riggenbachi]
MDTTTEDYLARIIGQKVKITTVSGCFQGLLTGVDPDRIVTLMKVKNLQTGQAVPGAKLIFGQNVLDVEIVEEPESTAEIQEPVSIESENILSQEIAASGHQEVTASLLHTIQRSVDNEDVAYTVIDQFQTNFGPTIRYLQCQKVLGLSAVGLDLFRYGNLCWLQVATKRHVYLFDILKMGPGVFKNGLQMVLEDKDILKVVHDCRWLGAILLHQYGVMMNNVFDTQVGDVYLFHMHTGGFLPHRTSTERECLTRYRNMPATKVNFLKYKQTLMKDNSDVWFTRPMPTALLKVLALEVMHLLDLRLAILDAMLADFTLLVDGYLNSYRQGLADVFDGAESSNSQLPKELQQLSILQRLRREKALKEHNVNSQGFLTRMEEN